MQEPDFQQVMEEYHKKSGNYANIGVIFRKNFIEYVRKRPDILLDKKKTYIKQIEEFNKNQVIREIIIDTVENISMSGRDLPSYILSKFGLKVSKNTVSEIAREKMTEEDYKKRFPALKDVVDAKMEREIIALIFDKRNLTQDDIAEEVGIKTASPVVRIAKKVLGKEDYKKRFPKGGKISEEKERKIIDLI